jgi:hypothetical protein
MTKQETSQALSPSEVSSLTSAELSPCERSALVERLLCNPNQRAETRLALALTDSAQQFAKACKKSAEPTRAWWYLLPAAAYASAWMMMSPVAQNPVIIEIVHNASFETDRDLFSGRFE